MPALLLCLALGALGFVIGPAFVGRFVPLDWQVGDVRPWLQGLQVAFGVAALVVLLARARVKRAFPTTGRLLAVGGVALLGNLLLVFAGELVLRAVGKPFSGDWVPLEVRLSRFDEELGWVYRPNQTVTRGSIPVHLDAIGARVPEPGHEHDPTRPAVLFVGGSFTFGHGVPYGECFAGRLAAQPGVPYEVVNLGVQAYGTDQAMLRLERHIDRFQTRVVVYTFVSAHVQRNANDDRRLLYPKARFIGTKPRFELLADGSLRLAHRPVLFEDLAYSRLGAFAKMTWANLGPPLTGDLTRALVARMRELCESRGAELIVVNWVQDTPMSAAFGERPFEGLGVHVIDPSQGAPADWDSWKIPHDGHPDARAHAHVADLLTDALGSRLR